MSALNETRWIEYLNKHSLLIVFGQATGVEETPHIHKDYNHISYGERYWEIRDCVPGFTEDLVYTEKIIEDVKKNNNINRIFNRHNQDSIESKSNLSQVRYPMGLLRFSGPTVLHCSEPILDTLYVAILNKSECLE